MRSSRPAYAALLAIAFVPPAFVTPLCAQQQQVEAHAEMASVPMTMEEMARKLIVVKAKNHTDIDFAANMLKDMWEKASAADPKLTKRVWVLAFHDKAVAGDVDGGYYYGAARLVGFGIAEGPDKEIAGYIGAAAAKNKPEALRDMAVLTFLGFGVKQDSAAAFALAKRAADAGLPSGQALAAEFYQAGVGTEKSQATTMQLFGKAAAAGDIIGEYTLGMLVQEGDPERAAVLFQKAAEGGDNRAMLAFGMALIRGQGIEKDEARGLQYVQTAAAAGETTAQELCGVYFLNGSHTAVKSDLKGRLYMESAAINGDDDAQYVMGMLYIGGERGVPKDEKTGLEWISKSAKQGNEDALKELRSRL